MNRTKGTPQNDRPMFDSVSSLVKAQSYELESMRKRGRTGQRLYLFYLLTVADTTFVRLLFDKEAIKPSEVDTECYVGRHIVNQEEVGIRVTFARIEQLDDLLVIRRHA